MTGLFRRTSRRPEQHPVSGSCFTAPCTRRSFQYATFCSVRAGLGIAMRARAAATLGAQPSAPDFRGSHATRQCSGRLERSTASSATRALRRCTPRSSRSSERRFASAPGQMAGFASSRFRRVSTWSSSSALGIARCRPLSMCRRRTRSVFRTRSRSPARCPPFSVPW